MLLSLAVLQSFFCNFAATPSGEAFVFWLLAVVLGEQNLAFLPLQGGSSIRAYPRVSIPIAYRDIVTSLDFIDENARCPCGPLLTFRRPAAKGNDMTSMSAFD